jgi:hypothetical protein
MNKINGGGGSDGDYDDFPCKAGITVHVWVV